MNSNSMVYRCGDWRSLHSRIGLHTAIWLQAKVRERGLGLWPGLYTGCVCCTSLLWLVALCKCYAFACKGPCVVSLIVVEQANLDLISWPSVIRGDRSIVAYDVLSHVLFRILTRSI